MRWFYLWHMLYRNIFLLLGSNLGDRHKQLSDAITLLTSVGTIVKHSSIYETAAWGKTDQPDFLNQVIELETQLAPHDLLTQCLSIEKKLGRERHEKWDARTIDIDIVYFDNKIIDTQDLQIPHSRMTERKFMLTPLVEIAPDFTHPILKKTNAQLLEECEDELDVRRI